MNRIQQRHCLDALLAQDVDPTCPADFVAVLAAFRAESDETRREKAKALLSSGAPSTRELEAHLRRALATAPPTEWRAEGVWILACETVGLAAQGGACLRALLPDELINSLDATVARVLSDFKPRLWTNPLVAAESREGPLPEVIPWTRIESGLAAGILHSDGSADPTVIEAWLEGRLHAEDAAALATWVKKTASEWREAYRTRIRKLAARAGVPLYDLRRSVSIAANDAELPVARLVQDLPLPHLGPNARREGRLHARGTHWQLCEAERTQAETVPYGSARLEWSDDVIGVLVTELDELRLDAVTVAEDAMVSIARLAGGLQHPRARSIAFAVAEDLTTGSLLEGMQEAAHALREAKLDTEEDERWAACVLQTQLEMTRLQHRLEDEELDEAMYKAEQAMKPHEAGVLLLDDQHYDGIVRGYDIDPEAWWGIRERLDEEVPTSLVIAAFGDSGVDTPREDVAASVASYRSRIDAELRERSGRVRRELRAAAASIREPGEVDLLVKLDDRRIVGEVLRVTIKLGKGGLFAKCPQFSCVARTAIEDAFNAAAASCDSGMPPHLLDDHEILLDGRMDITAIDGRSLGLPFVLAFASLWLNRALPAGLTATGRVYWAEGWRVGPVEYVLGKAAAFYQAAGNQPGTIMAAEEHEVEVREFSHTFIAVASAAQALRTAGLELDVPGLGAAWPKTGQRLDEIKRLTGLIQRQELEEFEGRRDVWSAAADRMRLLVEGVNAAAHAETVSDGRVYGALAYLHAGKIDLARHLAGGIEPAEPADKSAFVRDLVLLNAIIDEGHRHLCREACAALEGSLGLLTPAESRLVAGLAFGTVGRAWVHSGDPSTAIPWLKRAVDHHARYQRHELGRSRVHLAMALREAGLPGRARQEIELAMVDFTTHTDEWSGPYSVQCRAYALYELARIDLSLAQPMRALEHASEACRLERYQGFWPTLGIFRVLAWAHRALGEADEADAYVKRMKKLEVTREYEDLRTRLVREAEGLPIAGGEVY